LININSSSQIRSWTTSLASPKKLGSNVSSPSRLDKDATRVAPVAFAIRFKSTFLQRRTAMALASTKYYKTKNYLNFILIQDIKHGKDDDILYLH